MDEASRILSKGEAKRKERFQREFERQQRRMGLLRVPSLPKNRTLKSLPGQPKLFS